MDKKDIGKLFGNSPKKKKCLFTLDLKPFRSQVKEKHSAGTEFQSLAEGGKKLLTDILKQLGMVTEKSFNLLESQVDLPQE